MKHKIINTLFSDMCCSECRADFTEESVKIMREEKDIYVVQITCEKCGKSFGIALFGNCAEKDKKYSHDDLTLHVQEGPEVINFDDVLDAHKFIQNLDDDWAKHIPENLKK